MQSNKNFNLKAYNTFGIDVDAEQFIIGTTIDSIKGTIVLSHEQKKTLLILGGGSNVLFLNDYAGIVLKNDLRGITLIDEDENYVWVEAAAGEIWEKFVEYTIQQGWGGIENLALIPGNVGAAPIQNIGAYGIEVKDCIDEVKAIHCNTLQLKTFTKNDCHFGYRDSIFKKEAKGQYIIVSVVFKLLKHPPLNTSYGSIAEELTRKHIAQPSIQDVYNAVCTIRQAKLPDPKLLGNAGSFFKNPVVPNEVYQQLKLQHPNIVAYKNNDAWKLAAGWLIEQCGWKGARQGDAGVHDKQALVLVNYGMASGIEIIGLAGQIQEDVFARYGVTIEPEVNIIT